ncbi:hypothetical protein [Streptomonospora litoralis]|uniref:Uncharacterized protein n=1 Tax=Streptomonospora litoralis TaxID=2498135 RepID=A0A4P6PZD5_9ACTN|nr:hypothetical protein [Streptomonospora litoralis]QBI51869.1 hypothetical protein EKD16_00210 [Streptomonospora litoralis]
MTAVYRYLGGGWGEVEPPGGVADEFDGAWDVHCYRWVGSEYWVVRRREPLPSDAAEYGLRREYRGWSGSERIREWFGAQDAAWERRAAAQHRPGA